jgi:hypothetical protein
VHGLGQGGGEGAQLVDAMFGLVDPAGESSRSYSSPDGRAGGVTGAAAIAWTAAPRAHRS